MDAIAKCGRKSRVYLVDDHPLVREFLANLINRQADLIVCGEAECASRALREIDNLRPDLAIVDISLDEKSGLDLIKLVKANQPDLAIVVLSMHDEEHYAERCIRAGALGYVMKRESGTRITAAVRDALAGKMSVSDKMASIFAQKFVSGRRSIGHSPVESLSDRELEVFTLLGKGLTTRQVADAMNVSVKTVRAFCARIKPKLSLNTAGELLREAIHWHDQSTDGLVP